MGFWIFMAAVGMMTPLLMILVGYWLVRHPPRTINAVYGYRTAMSRRNQQTWDFAQSCCGRLWWKIGWGMGILTAPVALSVRGRGDDVVGAALGIWEVLQCVALVLTVPVVERALKKNFGRVQEPEEREKDRSRGDRQ